MDRPAEPLDPELLHRHAPGLRALVRSLVLDDNRVDDIVQETWLAALKRPPQRPEKAGAWLSVVARRIVQRGKRERARRAQREERAARPEGLPSAQEIVAREMARRELVDVVLELDEPYRTTVLLRYFEDLGPQEIAERIGAPLETVRTRLKRGLERLREKLDRRHGGEPRAWHLMLLPLANLPLGPYAPALPTGGGEGALAGAASGAPAASWFGFGALAAGALALGAGALGWVLLRSAGEPHEEGRGPEELAPLSASPRADAGAAEVARAESADALAGAFSLALRERSTAAPLAGVALGSAAAPWSTTPPLGWLRRALPGEEGEPGAEVARPLGASDRGGRLLVPRAEEERFPVSLDPRWSLVLPPESFAAQGELVLERAGALRGRVRAEGAAAQRALAAGEAQVRLVPTGSRDGRLQVGPWDALRGARGARAARDGSFAFDGLPLGLVYRLEVFAPGAGLGVLAPLALDAEGDAVQELPWRAEGARLEGYVAGAEGFPIAGARLALLYLGRASDAPERGRGEGELGPLELDAIARVETDAVGLFAFDALPDGRYRMEARAEGCEPVQRVLDVQSGATEPLALRLELGAGLEGLVLDAERRPVPNAAVAAFAPFARGVEHFVRTDERGRFRCGELPAGRLEVFARAGGQLAAQRVELLRGEVGWVELALQVPRAPAAARAPRPTADLRARLVERGTDRGIVGALVEVDAWRGRGGGRGEGAAAGGAGARPRAALSAAEGAFALSGLPAGKVHLRVRREGFGESSFELELAPGLAEPRLELAPAARLSGVLRDPEGRPLAGRSLVALGNGARVAETDAEGRFSFVDLAPGSWTLRAPGPRSSAEHDRGTGVLARLELAPGAEVLQDLVVAPLPTGRSTLIVRNALDSACALELEGAEDALGGIERPGRVAGGESARFAALPSGRYRLIAWGADGVVRLRELELGEGAAEFVLEATAAGALPLEARSPEGAALELLHLDCGANSGAEPPRGLGPSRGARSGRRAPSPRAVEVGSGSWLLQLWARDAEGRLFRGEVRIEGGEASAEGAGSTRVVELAPVALSSGEGAPADRARGEIRRR